MSRNLSVEDLSRLLQLILDIAEEDHCTPSEAIQRMTRLLSPRGDADRPETSRLAVFADRVRRVRLRRNELFGAPLFRDPAWDMLLELYAAHAGGRQVSVSSLCYASGVPPSTALRQITRLKDHGLIERRSDQQDERRWFVQATPKALAAVETAASMIFDNMDLLASPANDLAGAEPAARGKMPRRTKAGIGAPNCGDGAD